MEEALNGERPKLMQVGPYAYDEYYVKFDITWTDGGDTVTYGTQKYYIFNQDETGPGLSESDEIVLPYSTVAGFTYLLGTVPEQQQEMIDHAIYVSTTTIYVYDIVYILYCYLVLAFSNNILFIIIYYLYHHYAIFNLYYYYYFQLVLLLLFATSSNHNIYTNYNLHYTTTTLLTIISNRVN